MTVSELHAALSLLMLAGRSDQPVFIYNQTNVPVPNLEQVYPAHGVGFGHVVLRASRQYTEA